MSLFGCFEFNHFDKRMDVLEKLIIEGLKEIKAMATSVQQFDVLLTQLGTTIVNEDATVVQALSAADTVIAKLAAAVAAQGGNPDLATEATAVQSMIATATTDTQQLAAEVSKINALP